MRPPFPRSRLASTLGTILGTALASPALADIDAIAGSQDFDLTSVDTRRGTDFNITLGTAELKVHQIDPSVGVVTGATFKLSTHITDSLIATATHAAGASWTASFLSDPAVFASPSPQSAQPPVQLLTIASCTTTQASCTASQSGDYRFGTTLVAPPANLNAFVGQATTIGNLSLFTPIIPDVTPGTAISKADLTTTAQGKVEVDYTYLKHASPSFAARTPAIDESITFGTHSAQGKFHFFHDGKLFNVGGENTVGLDFDGIAGASGDTTVLRLQIPDFQGLAPGTNEDFVAVMEGKHPGVYHAQYKLHFSDADVGASASRLDYFTTIRLSGTIVPEPDTWALMLAGIGGVAWSARRRRRR